MDRTAAPVDHTVRRLAMVPVAAMSPAAAAQAGLTVHGERVARRWNLQGPMDLQGRPTIRAADHRVVPQVAVLHVEQSEQRLVLQADPMAQRVQRALMAQRVLMAHTRPVDLTVGNLNNGLGSAAVEWKLTFRRRQLVTSNSG